MADKVKIFASAHLDEVEENINAFLDKRDVEVLFVTQSVIERGRSLYPQSIYISIFYRLNND